MTRKSRTIRTFAKLDEDTHGWLEFHVYDGYLTVSCDEFWAKGHKPKMKVSRFVVSSHRSGKDANVVGVLEHAHLGYDRNHRHMMLRIFRKLVPSRQDDPKFRTKLRNHCTLISYQEVVEEIREHEKKLVSLKADRVNILKEMVENKKTKAEPIQLPLIK